MSRRLLWAAAAALLLAAAASLGGAWLATRPPVWKAKVDVRLVPLERTAYTEEVLGRIPVVLTFGYVLADRSVAEAAGETVGLDPDRVRSLDVVVRRAGASSALVIEVTGADRNAVTRLAPALVPAATSYLVQVAPLYRLETAGVGQTRRRTPWPLSIA